MSDIEKLPSACNNIMQFDSYEGALACKDAMEETYKRPYRTAAHYFGDGQTGTTVFDVFSGFHSGCAEGAIYTASSISGVEGYEAKECAASLTKSTGINYTTKLTQLELSGFRRFFHALFGGSLKAFQVVKG